MELKISQVAKMTGFSASGIRYLEKEGLLTPAGGRKGNQRSYDISNVSDLLHCRNFRECGFGMNEISALLKTQELQAYLDIYERKSLELEETLQKQIRLLRFLHRKKQEIEMVRDKESFVEEGLRPAILFFPLEVNACAVTEWPKALEIPYADSALLFNGEELKREGEMITPKLGLGIWEEDSTGHYITQTGRMRYFPAAKALHCIVEIREDLKLSLQELKPLRERLEAVRMTGTVLSKRILSQKEGEATRRYDHFWVDIR